MKSRRTEDPRRSRGRDAVEATVRVDDLAPGGMGVAHAVFGEDSRAIFIPRVTVGDEVVVAIDLAARPARGRVVRLVAAGEGRVAPPCAYVDTCGACDWMHVSRNAQRAARESHLRRALPPAFRDALIAFHDGAPSLGYRTRARLHVRVSGGRAIVGPNAMGSNDVVDLATCIVLHPSLDAALRPIAAILDGAHGVGEVQLALGKGGKPVLDLRWEGQLPAVCYGRAERAVTDGVLAGAVLHEGSTPRPARIGDPSPEMAGADGSPLRLPPGGFAQASDAGNVELATRVAALARDLPFTTKSVLELYAGAGNFTVMLAAAFERVVAVESSSEACEAARENLTARRLKAKVTCGDADTMPLPPKTDLVLLDPPRRGAKAVCEALRASTVKGVIYVSCDAPTLGRDLSILSERFDLVALESFAMFPGTSHSETIAVLARRAR